MTPDEQALFIQLWEHEAQYPQIAEIMHISYGTVASRARALQQRGLIQPRPRGGHKPAPTLAPVQSPVQMTDTGAEQIMDTGAVSSVDIGAVHELDTGAVQRLDRLEGEVQGLVRVVQSLVDRLNHPPVTPVQITALPHYPKGKAVRWNLWILDAIRDEIVARAEARDMSASQVVQELLWKGLHERDVSTP
jgi:hypothetical protein